MRRLSAQLPDWKVIEQHHILKTFLFDDFKSALAYVNRIGEVAEQEGHHPDLYLAWGKVDVTIYTHKIRGLTESDFILAAKIGSTSSIEPPAEPPTHSSALL